MDNHRGTKLPIPIEHGPGRRLVAGWLVSVAGYTGLYVLLPGWILGLAAAGEQQGGLVQLVLFLATMPMVLLIIPRSVGFIARGRRMRALPADELLRRDERPPVVLLRSFSDDDLIDPFPGGTYKVVPGRYENRLVEALAALGPVIALGRPGEKTPELGAARLYVKDEYWQRAIEYLMARAIAVVAVVGGSPGLWWEIESAIQLVPAERLLFFFPYPAPQGTRSSYWRAAFLQNQVFGRFVRQRLFPVMDAERQSRYKAFRERVNTRLPQPLPEALGDARFIAFSPEGEPMLIKPAKSSMLTRALTLKLHPQMDIPFKRELQQFVATKLNAARGQVRETQVSSSARLAPRG